MNHNAGEPRPASKDSGRDDGASLDRKDVGDARSSSEHPPHVARHEKDAPIQDGLPSPEPVPTTPANASGSDEATTEEQAEPIDEESMYDRRPEEHKHISPSDRASERGSS